MPKVIIDYRMRKIEKEYLRTMGYELIENGFNYQLYDEISAHPDVYYSKINDTVFCEPSRWLDLPLFVKGVTIVENDYPKDVPYNVCIVGKHAIHNFKYTDKVVKAYIEKSKFDMVDVKQGYSKCSTCVLSSNACITSDIGIATSLLSAGVDVMYAKETDIKLLKRINNRYYSEDKLVFEYSQMEGFIGGAMVRLKDTVVLFGDKKYLSNGRKIEAFIQKQGLEFKYFEGLDIIDYGSVVEVL